MSRFALVSTLSCTAWLAACSAVAPAGAPAGSASGTASSAPAVPAQVCNAAPAQSLIGQATTATVVESARVRSGAQMVRILRPGQMVTKEFDAQRLNLEVDASGRIIAVRCG